MSEATKHFAAEVLTAAPCPVHHCASTPPVHATVAPAPRRK